MFKHTKLLLPSALAIITAVIPACQSARHPTAHVPEDYTHTKIKDYRELYLNTLTDLLEAQAGSLSPDLLSNILNNMIRFNGLGIPLFNKDSYQANPIGNKFVFFDNDNIELLSIDISALEKLLVLYVPPKKDAEKFGINIPDEKRRFADQHIPTLSDIADTAVTFLLQQANKDEYREVNVNSIPASQLVNYPMAITLMKHHIVNLLGEMRVTHFVCSTSKTRPNNLNQPTDFWDPKWQQRQQYNMPPEISVFMQR